MSPGGKHIADGYCILFRKDVLKRFGLNEDYQWWFGLPWTESQILKSGYGILAVNNHENYIHHFGGRSGDDWKKAKGMEQATSLYDKFFNGKNQVECIYDLDKEVGSDLAEINRLRGLYEDGWCGKYIDFEIRTLQKGILVISGYYPGKVDGSQKIELRAGRRKRQFIINQDHFEFEMAVKKNSVIRASMECRFAKRWSEDDIREMAFVVKDIKAT